MPNPIGKEQRKKLRELLVTDTWTYRTREAALDGLDIADMAMRATLVMAVLHEVTSIDERAFSGWVREWYEAAETAADEALRDWQAWKEKGD